MSTKITLDYEMGQRFHDLVAKGTKRKPRKAKCEAFHAYLDCMDQKGMIGGTAPGTVYLEIEGDSITIPPKVWARLMKIGPIPSKRGRIQHYDLPKVHK